MEVWRTETGLYSRFLKGEEGGLKLQCRGSDGVITVILLFTSVFYSLFLPLLRFRRS